MQCHATGDSRSAAGPSGSAATCALAGGHHQTVRQQIMRRRALRDVQTEPAARRSARGVARAGPRAGLLRLAAAERADGAVAKQLDALENHPTRGPERRTRSRPRRRGAASYCGGDARRLARRAAAFESNEFGVSETKVAARAAGARRGERRLRPLRGRGAANRCRAELRSSSSSRRAAPSCASSRARRSPGRQVFIAYVPLWRRARAPGVPARHVRREVRLRALPGGTAGRHAGRGGAARDGGPPLRVRRAAAAPGVLSVGRRGRPAGHAAAAANLEPPSRPSTATGPPPRSARSSWTKKQPPYLAFLWGVNRSYSRELHAIGRARLRRNIGGRGV